MTAQIVLAAAACALAVVNLAAKVRYLARALRAKREKTRLTRK